MWLSKVAGVEVGGGGLRGKTLLRRLEVWNGELCRGMWGTQSQTYPLLTIRYYTLLYSIAVLASVCIQTILQLPFHASFPEQKGATFELDLWNRQKDGEKLTCGDGGVIQTNHTNEPYGFIRSKTTSDWHGEKLGWINNKNSFNLRLRSKVLQTFFKLITFHHLQHPWYAIWDWLPFQWTTMSFCGFRKIKSWLRRTTFSAVLMWRWHLQWWSFGCESRSRVKKGLMLLGMDVWLSSFLVGKAFLVCLVGHPCWPSIIFLYKLFFVGTCFESFEILRPVGLELVQIWLQGKLKREKRQENHLPHVHTHTQISASTRSPRHHLSCEKWMHHFSVAFSVHAIESYTLKQDPCDALAIYCRSLSKLV